MQYDHVGRLDAGRVDGDVVQSPHGSSLQPGGAQQLIGLRVVGRGELEVHRPAGAALEQLDLDLAGAAAHL